MFSLIAAIDSN